MKYLRQSFIVYLGMMVMFFIGFVLSLLDYIALSNAIPFVPQITSLFAFKNSNMTVFRLHSIYTFFLGLIALIITVWIFVFKYFNKTRQKKSPVLYNIILWNAIIVLAISIFDFFFETVHYYNIVTDYESYINSLITKQTPLGIEYSKVIFNTDLSIRETISTHFIFMPVSLYITLFALLLTAFFIYQNFKYSSKAEKMNNEVFKKRIKEEQWRKRK